MYIYLYIFIHELIFPFSINFSTFVEFARKFYCGIYRVRAKLWEIWEWS